MSMRTDYHLQGKQFETGAQIFPKINLVVYIEIICLEENETSR